MQKQKEMENTMLQAHREFVHFLTKSMEIIKQELAEAGEMTDICTDEWCKSTEVAIDDIHKQVYSIHEPRFATKEDSDKIRQLRQQVKDLYVTFRGISAKAA